MDNSLTEKLNLSMNKIRLAVLDDHKMFRQATHRLLISESDITVVTEASDGFDLLQKLEKNQVDIVLMDGITATFKVLKLFPNSKIIAFSQYDYETNILKMYSLGVKCFISKGGDPKELFKAIRIVHNGGTYITDEFSEIIKRNLIRKEYALHQNQFNFSEKENEMLRMIIGGYTSKEIGDRLNKSHRTIEDHREKLYNRLGVKNKLELIAMVYEITSI